MHLPSSNPPNLQRHLSAVRQAAEQREIRALAARDREVRNHEQAHAAVGGRYTGSPHYELIRGPDGVGYAHAGHVDIDVGVVPNDPEATLHKMQIVSRAALAPTEPSAQDRAVAARANRQAVQARAEMAARSHQALQDMKQDMMQEGSSGQRVDVYL